MAESKLLGLAAGAHGLQNVVIDLLSRWHPQFVHSLEKIKAIKMAFHFVNYEGVEGDYLEFGVFEGASFITSFKSHRATNQGTERRFVGFDSFEGLRFDEGEASHESLKPGTFATSYERVKSRIGSVLKDRVEWHLVQGFVDVTLESDTVKALNVEKVAVAMFDMDLGEPTKLALKYVGPRLSVGSVLIFDEFFMFKGDAAAGEAGALDEFLRANPNIKVRRYLDYGAGGRVFIVSAV